MRIAYIPDEYAWRARAVPVVIAIAPALVALILLGTPWHLALKGSTLALGISVIAWVLALTGGLPGKRLEQRLWEKQGGPPTVRFLRRGNEEYNQFTRCRVHAKLRALGLDLPSSEEEAHHPDTATLKWKSCVDELIRRTRNRDAFPLVFQNLTDYGMHRNMLGFKWPGIISSLLAIAAGGWFTFDAIKNETNPAEPIATLATALAILIVWLGVATQRNLKTSDERYARSLLEAAIQLEK